MNHIEQLMKENNIDFIDLDSKVPKTTDFYFDSVHYTEKGNLKIAESLFDYIVSNEIIDTK